MNLKPEELVKALRHCSNDKEIAELKAKEETDG